MEFIQYMRKPFMVEAIEITEENIEEVAKFIGKVRINEDTEIPFISLDRRIVPNVGRAYVGWWFTRLGDNYRCYAPKVFSEQFVQQATLDQQLFKDLQASNVFAMESHSVGNISVLETDVV